MSDASFTDLPWPRLWAEGTLFAFSGIDGPTRAASGMVATLHDRPGTLLIHTPKRRILDLGWGTEPEDTPDIDAVTGDVLIADGYRVTWSAWHTLVGEFPPGAKPTLTVEGNAEPVMDEPGETRSSVEEKDAVVLRLRVGRFALSFGQDREEADRRAAEGIGQAPDDLIPSRLRFFERLPASVNATDSALAIKLASVMKVNTLAPEGPFATRWSTPDRVPHRDLWLWDSAFHSLGMNHLDADLAWEFLEAAIHTQKDDGLIPHQTGPTGWQSKITQPPVLAWACWENFKRTQNTERLRGVLPKLAAYLAWDQTHRDRNNNRLLEWAPTDHHPGCESGLDNSPRFDCGRLDAVDFTTFLIHDLRHVAKIVKAVGDDQTRVPATEQADLASAALHDRLWHDKLGIYIDRDAADGTFSPTRAVSDFFPLLLEDLSSERVDRLIGWLEDGTHFDAQNPIPSVSLADPAWGTDMWRGASWINANYLVVVGLRRHGRHAQAERLAEKTIAMVRDGIDRFGVTFEFYDANGQTDPIALDRKGPRRVPYDLRTKMDSIRDYHWTAALTLDLVLADGVTSTA